MIPRSSQEQVQRLINDLDDARADGTIYTYGMVQARLVEILKAAT